MSLGRAPPLAWNHHMTLCTQHCLCAPTVERVKVASNQRNKQGREKGRRSLINDHMLWEISSRQIWWLGSTWRKFTDSIITRIKQKETLIIVYFLSIFSHIFQEPIKKEPKTSTLACNTSHQDTLHLHFIWLQFSLWRHRQYHQCQTVLKKELSHICFLACICSHFNCNQTLTPTSTHISKTRYQW